MNPSFRFDLDERETAIRTRVAESLREHPPPELETHVVASYFFVLRTATLDAFAAELAYHATSGSRQPAAGSLVEQCTGEAVGIDAFDRERRTGVLQMAFPLTMLRHTDGHVSSTDLLHTTASAIAFDVYECQDAKLVSLTLPHSVITMFPGPAHGPDGFRALVGLPDDARAFGTILKPTAGLTPTDLERAVAEVAATSLLVFVKEDENFYPDLPYAPLKERTRRAVGAISQARAAATDRQLVFAPHITAAPHELIPLIQEAIHAGATGVMLSETFAGGAFRMVREATRAMETPPVIYGHNAGIGTRTRSIWREVIDLLARLDGIDVRQTAPVLPGTPFLRPFADEWRASEAVLASEIPGIKQTMIARAGGLDQGNLIMNLQEAEARKLDSKILYLAGSAITSIKNRDGHADPRLGATAMGEAETVHNTRQLDNVSPGAHVAELLTIARRDRLDALETALTQRYPEAA